MHKKTTITIGWTAGIKNSLLAQSQTPEGASRCRQSGHAQLHLHGVALFHIRHFAPDGGGNAPGVGAALGQVSVEHLSVTVHLLLGVPHLLSDAYEGGGLVQEVAGRHFRIQAILLARQGQGHEQRPRGQG